MKSDETFMMLALAESKKGLPECIPNPPVGCVLVKDWAVVATGYTKAIMLKQRLWPDMTGL